MKREYLAGYDYGSGGVWIFIWARSPEEIVARYPDLTVVDVHPAWMDAERVEQIRHTMTFDIDSPAGWLLSLQRID